MEAYIAEFIGTALLLLLGSGVVANVLLDESKGKDGGWLVICWAWAIAVFLGVYTATTLGGSGHLNPAVTLGLAAFGGFDAAMVPGYIAAQVAGAFVGSSLAWLTYKPHFDATADADVKLAIFCTTPAIRNTPWNLITEAIGTFVLVFGALSISAPTDSLGALDALPVALLVLGIGLALGGPTGYAINPARDFGPRLAHAVLPISGKRDADWGYAWVPIVAPIVGGLLGAGLFSIL
ncbi:MAG: aquaporin family protein [Flavobacteriales bacterium]|nr:aquaporin family protein [Flavobacteriales bacterium]